LQHKNVEELESLVSSLDDRFKLEINTTVEAALKEKDEIINEMISREVAEVRRKNMQDKEEILIELERREAMNQK
jgi:hypothetical protein